VWRDRTSLRSRKGSIEAAAAQTKRAARDLLWVRQQVLSVARLTYLTGISICVNE
jgi:hypothetical protein